MINNELKSRNGCYLLAYADTWFTSAEPEQPETRTYNCRSVPSVSENSTIVYRFINNGIFVLLFELTLLYVQYTNLEIFFPINLFGDS